MIFSHADMARINAVVKFAHRRENWYNPIKSKMTLPKTADYMTDIVPFHCIYSLLHDEEYPDVFFRQLSVSNRVDPLDPVPPTNDELWNIAEAFGFTGAIKHQDKIVAPASDWFFTTVVFSTSVAQRVDSHDV